MRLDWTQRARAVLLATGEAIAEDNPRRARRWVEKFRDRAREAATSRMSILMYGTVRCETAVNPSAPGMSGLVGAGVAVRERPGRPVDFSWRAGDEEVSPTRGHRRPSM